MKLAVDTDTPFFKSVTEVIPDVVAPVSVKVRLVRFTGLIPGFVMTICSNDTPEAPGNCELLPGGDDPCETSTVTGVGDGVGVFVGVPVFTRVLVTVEVTVRVALLVAVEVGVSVAVFAKVLVKVGVAVLLGV